MRIDEAIRALQSDSRRHDQIGATLSDGEIIEAEARLTVVLPNTYKTFLREFGDGAYWLYGCQPVDSIRRPLWLTDIRRRLSSEVEIDGEDRRVSAKSLLCLMSEDSNGGSWCWLTKDGNPDGEWPLAYYSMEEERLFYKQAGFEAWLTCLIEAKSEVVRALDVSGKLGLG